MPLSRELKDAINEICRRCGHTFYQHSTGGMRGRCEAGCEDDGTQRCGCEAYVEASDYSDPFRGSRPRRTSFGQEVR